MRISIWTLLFVALAGVWWLLAPEREAEEAGAAVVAPADEGDLVESSGYRLTGANWSTDRTQPVYVPPHQRKALGSAPRRKAEAAARTLDERTLLDGSVPTARLRAGAVVVDPLPDTEKDEVAIE